MRVRIVAGAAMACAGLAVTAGPAAADPFGVLTAVKPYVKPVGPDYQITPLLSAGDRVPETSDPSKEYQMVGIPDGLGAYRVPGGRGRVELYMNHELGQTAQSQPTIGQPLNRGAIVSKYRLAPDGSVISGERAYDTVYRQNTLVGPAAEVGNTTGAFARFCSGFLAGPWTGFDRPIYLAGEESEGAATFDGRGGQAVAIFDNQIHTLPKLGRFAKENVVVVPNTGRRTVIMGLEDGPSTPDSQLWMYVGRKRPAARTVLGRNGLDNGDLYVWKAFGKANEDSFTGGSVGGEWIEIPDAADMSESELEAAADAEGAFGFYRIEDGESGRPGEFFFVTTGAGGANKLGRVYRLSFNPRHPLWGASLRVIQNADEIVAAGGDTALSPDNVAFDGRYLMVNEDGTGNTRPIMASKGRDGSVWRFDTANGYQRDRVAQLDPPGRDGVAVGAGVWESSGVIDASGLLGPSGRHGGSRSREAWLYDVQAHPPTAAPGVNTVEDGQLVLMTRTRPRGHR